MAHRLAVIGTGYLGATHAACMAELGHEVLGIDVDHEKVARLAAGDLPFHEPGLEQILRRNLDTGRLAFTTSFKEVADFGDVHFLCVGTPQLTGSNAADLSQVTGAVDALLPHLRRECLIVGKSTVPVGTAAALADRITANVPIGADLAWNPEFLREGHAVEDTLRPDRIVIGATSERAGKVLREVYAKLLAEGIPLVLTDYETAELVKVSANAFLATKISFINAMAEVCEAAHADVTRLSEALSYDDRIGGKFLNPGLGFGGGCLPKDIRAFMARAEELGVDQALSFLREVDAINMRRRARTVDLVRELLGGTLAGKVIGVLGASFKPGSDDIRDSPALDVASTIRDQGATVTVYDPAALANARRLHPHLGYARSTREAVCDADAVLLLTEWREFRDLDPEEVGKVVRTRNVVDGRNALDAERWREAGWVYRALGRP